MKYIIVYVFRWLFKLSFFKKRFFGFHEHVFIPLKLLKGVKIKVKYNGFKMELHLEDWIQENIFFLNAYEKAELIATTSLLQKDSIFLDIGANIGVYSLNASKIIGKEGKIISFEPFSVNYKKFLKNIETNHITTIKAENMAVGKETGILTLFYNSAEGNLGMVSAVATSHTSAEEVKMISIDEYIKQDAKIKKIDFIKIDIEGYEYNALLGMKTTLREFQPHLLIEILDEDPKAANYQQVENLLSSLGYHKYFISDGGEIRKEVDNPNRKNYLFSPHHLV